MSDSTLPSVSQHNVAAALHRGFGALKLSTEQAKGFGSRRAGPRFPVARRSEVFLQDQVTYFPIPSSCIWYPATATAEPIVQDSVKPS